MRPACRWKAQFADCRLRTRALDVPRSQAKAFPPRPRAQVLRTHSPGWTSVRAPVGFHSQIFGARFPAPRGPISQPRHIASRLAELRPDWSWPEVFGNVPAPSDGVEYQRAFGTVPQLPHISFLRRARRPSYSSRGEFSCAPVRASCVRFPEALATTPHPRRAFLPRSLPWRVRSWIRGCRDARDRESVAVTPVWAAAIAALPHSGRAVPTNRVQDSRLSGVHPDDPARACGGGRRALPDLASRRRRASPRTSMTTPGCSSPSGCPRVPGQTSGGRSQPFRAASSRLRGRGPYPL